MPYRITIVYSDAYPRVEYADTLQDITTVIELAMISVTSSPIITFHISDLDA